MASQERVGFVWTEGMPFVPGAGGSETYTKRQITELEKQGIDARLILHANAPPSDLKALDVPVQIIKDKDQLAKLDDNLVFVLEPSFGCSADELSKTSYIFLHTPIYAGNHDLRGHRPLVPSRFMSNYWQKILGLPEAPPVIYPPIDSEFSQVPRQAPGNIDIPKNVLFAGRPSVDKGIYTLFASMHFPSLQNREYQLTCVKTVNHPGGADIIHSLYDAHPDITTVAAQPDIASMARLLATQDVLVMPSAKNTGWIEAFGMLSVEAQHAGCRVVAANNGGLPETDCGGLILVEPDNPQALAQGIATALDMGPLNSEERTKAALHFTVQDSVKALRQAIKM